MKRGKEPSGLHAYSVPVHGEGHGRLEDYSIGADNPNFDRFEVHLRNQEEILVQKILQYKDGLIVGCVAWLTSIPILDALAQCKKVQILVQKEDFLRPDVNILNNSGWKGDLAARYAKIKCDAERHQFIG